MGLMVRAVVRRSLETLYLSKSETTNWHGCILDANHSDTRTWLEKEIAYLDPFIIEALLADETCPRMTEIDGGVLLILRGVNLNKGANP